MKFGNDPFSKFDPAGVERYVRNILDQSIPAFDPLMGAGHYNTEITDTHQYMIIKIHIPTKAEARDIRLHVAATQLKLEKKVKSQRKVQVIPLSYPVDPKSCKAAYKDGILQLHIRKQQEEEIFYEIDVKYL